SIFGLMPRISFRLASQNASMSFGHGLMPLYCLSSESGLSIRGISISSLVHLSSLLLHVEQRSHRLLHVLESDEAETVHRTVREKPAPHVDVFLRQLGRADRQPPMDSILLRRRSHALDGFPRTGLGDLTEAIVTQRQVAGADHQHVDPLHRRDLLDVLD